MISLKIDWLIPTKHILLLEKVYVKAQGRRSTAEFQDLSQTEGHTGFREDSSMVRGHQGGGQKELVHPGAMCIPNQSQRADSSLGIHRQRGPWQQEWQHQGRWEVAASETKEIKPAREPRTSRLKLRAFGHIWHPYL